MVLRSPIIVTVGHVDHGKTTLLDKIRGTLVTKAEPGELTQHVGASYIPIDTVKKICGDLLQKFKIKIDVPGLLLLDTPGHAAFITLRKRGGSVSDLAILVIDINEGFQEQTDESLTVLKKFKTPFIVAATKIDRTPAWNPNKGMCFLDSFEKQRDDVKDELEKKIYTLVSQLSERGFDSDRFDRVEDFSKKIAIVPCSGLTGEGIAELLTVLAGISQQFLKNQLEFSEMGKGIILEVKEVTGLGTTIDVILYDGRVRKNDYIVIGGNQTIVTKIKALFEPAPLRELRVEKQFKPVDEVEAAAGLKISAPNLENVIAGSPLIVARDEKEVERAKEVVQEEVEEVKFVKQLEGVVIRADTLGSLEAMIKILTEENVPIRKAEVGNASKQDITELQNVSSTDRKAILAFNVKVPDEINQQAKDLGIKIFENKIIYRVIDEYKDWLSKKKETELKERMESVTRPCRIKILKGFIFRVSNPAIFGVEVQKGILKTGVLMKKDDGKIIGKIKEIQKEGQNISEVKSGEKVAVSMEEPTIGRQIEEGDVLIAELSAEDLKILKIIYDKLSEDEKELLKVLI